MEILYLCLKSLELFFKKRINVSGEKLTNEISQRCLKSLILFERYFLRLFWEFCYTRIKAGNISFLSQKIKDLAVQWLNLLGWKDFVFTYKEENNRYLALFLVFNFKKFRQNCAIKKEVEQWYSGYSTIKVVCYINNVKSWRAVVFGDLWNK